MWNVYILSCKDRTLYTGITTDLKRRLNEHKIGKGGHYTSSHKAVKLLYKESLKTRSEALKREAEIKKLSKYKKINLIKYGKQSSK